MGQQVNIPGDLNGEKNDPLVCYYASKHGLLIVAHPGQFPGQSRWATNTSPW
jgi:hypothetical protein